MAFWLATVSLLAAILVVIAPAQKTDAQEGECLAPFGVEGCWDVDLFDTFDGDAINRDIWEPGWFVDEGYSVSVNNRENACYNTDQVVVGGSTLQIRLDSTTDPACLDKQGDTVDLVGGIVSSRDAIQDPAHGGRLDDSFYIEARIRVPEQDGQVVNWPAFWTTGFGPWPATGEIDILEGLGGDAKFNYHYQCSDGRNCQAGAQRHPVTSGDGEWHTYGALRRLATTSSPATITFFFDGVAVATIEDNVVRSPHYIIFTYTSHQDENPIAPGSTMLVDWVRSWSLAEPDPGDATCSDGVDVVDALAIAQYSARVRTDSGGCPLTDPETQLFADAGDLNDDGSTDIIDALIVAQCSVGLPNPHC